MLSTKLPSALKMQTGMRNALLSAGLCLVLIAAYYMAIGHTKLPPDLHISYDARGCGGTCPLQHVELKGDGAFTVTTPGGSKTTKVSDFAVHRVFQAFVAVHFLDRDVSAYRTDSRHDICQLSLTADHRKTAIRYACGNPAPEIARPLAALLHSAAEN